MKGATDNMIEVLQNSSNPKFRNSKFLKFLKKLNVGAYKIENDQLQKDSTKLGEFKMTEKERVEKEVAKEKEEEEAKVQKR